ncbi:LysR substrate-binding domain-containing protein [Sorangium sp. So ce726]|uniref:LysR family transcriptional regulator n=1 Tax=Sorangium sp. So ce726 TaxID=3133319 RepID=UPI003F5E24B5
MFDFDAMATFVEVAQLGSFSAAAKALRLPRSTVSERVARLEASLGVRLLERTTRVVRPTSAGAAYHERCARILSEMEEANAAVKDLESSPRGVLRVATPLLFGQSFLASVAAAFTQSHPAVEIEIVASEHRVNPIEDGFDVAIMLFASDDDSSLIAQRLKGGDLWLCATPSYLEARGRPKSPAGLDEHACIVYGESRMTRWTFERGREVRRVDVRGALSMNSFGMLHEAVCTGVGIAPVPSILCAEDVRSGRLVRVLADWSIDRKDLRVVYPSNRHLSPRVRLFVDMLVAEFRKREAATAEPPASDKRSARARRTTKRGARRE